MINFIIIIFYIETDAITNGGILKKYDLISTRSITLNVSEENDTFIILDTIPSFTMPEGILFAVLKVTFSNVSITTARYYNYYGETYIDTGGYIEVGDTIFDNDYKIIGSSDIDTTYSAPRTIFNISRSFYVPYITSGSRSYLFRQHNVTKYDEPALIKTIDSFKSTIADEGTYTANGLSNSPIYYCIYSESGTRNNNYKLSATGTITYEIYGYK